MLLLVFSVGVWAETIKYENSKYVGDALNGVLHGQGTLTFSNGDKYVGEWKDDKAHGQGTYTCADGRKNVGEFTDGLMHGQGTKYNKDGNVTFTGDAEKREKCYNQINHNLKGAGMVFDSQMCESIRQRMLSLNSKLLHSPGLTNQQRENAVEPMLWALKGCWSSVVSNFLGYDVGDYRTWTTQHASWSSCQIK